MSYLTFRGSAFWAVLFLALVCAVPGRAATNHVQMVATATNKFQTLEIPRGRMARLLDYNKRGSWEQFRVLFWLPGRTQEPFHVAIGSVIIGPAVIGIAGYDRVQEMVPNPPPWEPPLAFAVFEITDVNVPRDRPETATVIPGGIGARVDVETSTDLEHWGTAKTGEQGANELNRFFRIRVTLRE